VYAEDMALVCSSIFHFLFVLGILKTKKHSRPIFCFCLVELGKLIIAYQFNIVSCLHYSLVAHLLCRTT